MTIVSVEKKKKKPNYFRLVQEELGKVTWTSKKELLLCTKVVICSMFVFGLGIFGADLLIRNSLQLLNTLVGYVGG